MKKLLLTAAAVFAITTVSAQTEQGNWIIGTDTGIAFTSSSSSFEFDGISSDEEASVSTFDLSPNVSYFIMDNLSIGLGFTFSSSTTTFNFNNQETKTKSNSISIIPNATYFFKTDKLAPFVGFGAGLISASAGDEDFQKNSGLVFSGAAGLAYFTSDFVSINFIVNYTNATISNKERSEFKTKTNSLGLGIGFSVYL